MSVPLWRDVSNPFTLKRTFEEYMKKHRNAGIYISHLIACDGLPLPYFMVSDIFSRHISELPCIHLLTFHILIIHFLTHRKFALLFLTMQWEENSRILLLSHQSQQWFSLFTWVIFPRPAVLVVLVRFWICSQSSNPMLSWHWVDILYWLMRIIYSGHGCVALCAVCFFWTYAPILRGPIDWF